MAMTGSCECGCASANGTHLERVRYFSRQLITPDDLTQEQEYFRAKMRRHNRMLHGWGIVRGAEVVKNDKVPSDVIVKPGYLLGPYGDEIVIDNEITVDMCKEGLDGNALPCGDLADPWCSEVRVSRPTGVALYLAVKYADCPTRPVRAYPSGCGCGCQEGDCQYSRTRDSFAVKVLTDLPATYANVSASSPDTPPSPCDPGGQIKPPLPCPSEPWVLIADVTLDANCAVSKIDLSTHRRYVMSFADYFITCAPTTPTTHVGQSNWAWCNKCQGLAFAGNPLPGACPAGGSHNHGGSGNYTLTVNQPSGPGTQSNWRWCTKCQGLSFADNATPGACPAGGSHDHAGSGNYALTFSVPGGSGQSNWRWCTKCQGLSFAGGATLGACPAGGSHDHAGSGNYALTFNSTPLPQQSNWRWCNKCQELTFAGNATAGTCAAGGSHTHVSSGNYALAVGIGDHPGGQSNWRWCNKCQALTFGGNATLGPCSAGGGHDHVGSGDYVLSFNVGPGKGAQSDWRWCNKCQALSFAGNATLGACPAGGSHNHSGSGDYLLAQV